MNAEIKLNDIADELLILDKRTIDKLFQTDDPMACVGLYIFYYKTAKWQKTNRIKASDAYVKQCLKIGTDKLRKIKTMLKEKGLIQVVQGRKGGKINGWFIEVSYLVSKAKMDISVSNNTQNQQVAIQEESNNTQNQQVGNPTSSIQETNALKEIIKCLKTEIEMLKKGKGEKEKIEFLQFGEKVKLSLPAYEKLKAEYGELLVSEYIEKINSYLTENEKGIKKGEYKNYAQTIRNWIASDNQTAQPDDYSSNEPSVKKIPTWREKVEILSGGNKSSEWYGRQSKKNW